MRPLTGRYQAIIYGSDTAWQDYYPDQFRARRAVTLSAVNLGWTLDECRHEFLRPDNPGSYLWTHNSRGRLLPPAKQSMRLLTDYESAARKALSEPPFLNGEDARQFVGVVKARVWQFPWKGRAGRTDRDVMLYVCHRATAAACTLVNVSARDAALGAGVTRRTASNSLLRLVKQGWLTRTGERERQYALAQEYLITRGKVATFDPYVFPDPQGFIWAKRSHPEHECWVRLGKSAMAIWSVLDQGPMSGRRIAALTLISRRAVANNLAKLAQYGLAEKSELGWSVGRLGPDEVVEHQGWLGKQSMTEFRKLDYAEDRAMFRNWYQGEATRDDYGLAS